MAVSNSTKNGNYKHGRSETVEYNAYRLMKARCYRPTCPSYRHYGGRGIKICERWLNGEGGKLGVVCFLEDMGARPSPKHSIDRINNDGDYEPENCRWATMSEQTKHRRNSHLITAGGRTQTITDWARELGVITGSISGRIRRGMSPADAVLTPRKGKYKGK